MRLLHLSDPHVTAGGRQIAGRDPERSLSEAIDVLERCELGDLDAVLVTGDLSSDASATAYAFVEAQLRRLDLPVLVLAGNHDDPGAIVALRERLAEPSSARRARASVVRGPAPLDAAYHHDGLTIALLDTRSGSSDEAGHLSDATLAWLEHSVVPASVRVLVALHQPPIALAPGVAPVGNAAALAEIVRAAPTIVTILAGHVHRCSVSSWSGTLLATVSSPNHQIAFATRSDGGYVISDEPGMAGLLDLCAAPALQYVPLRGSGQPNGSPARDGYGPAAGGGGR